MPTLYTVEIQNNGNDQMFIVEADDLISAHMKGNEFADTLDRRIKQRFNVTQESKVISLARWGVLFANDEGIEEYLEDNIVYFEAE